MLKKLIYLWKHSKCLELIAKAQNKKFRKKFNNPDFTLLTPNCMAGLIYHRLGQKFNSPTIDLSIQTSDFCCMLENLDYYMSQDVVECTEQIDNVDMPVGIIKGNEELPDIRINFVHYKSFEQGREKWNQRKARIIPENTYVIMCDIGDIYERDCSKAGYVSDDDLKKLESFSCNNKVLLTRDKNRNKDYAYYIKPEYKRAFPLVYMNRDILAETALKSILILCLFSTRNKVNL